MAFTPPPDEQERIQAIGPLEGLSPGLQRAFTPGTLFEPIPRPGTGDWLAEHDEPGQTFEDFLKSHPAAPAPPRDKIYLQPLGDFPKGNSPSLEMLQACAAAYFVTPVDLLAPLEANKRGFRTRLNPASGNLQVLTTDVLAGLLNVLPGDAFCLLAVSMEDLYPHPSWNFVFGQASVEHRVGVFSFARYDPSFYGGKRIHRDMELLLRRSCKVLVHELAHMFGLMHCIYFSCLENGSNHLEESDQRPLHFCPVCLRKLLHSIGFEVLDRYERLAEFHTKVGFNDELDWIRRRIGWIQGD